MTGARADRPQGAPRGTRKAAAPVLKTIGVAELRLGMFVHRVGGSWLDHPFWTTRFELRDAADLQRLRSSGVQHCVIDTARGLDVAAAPAPVAAPTVAPADVAAPPIDSEPVKLSISADRHAGCGDRCV
jgi:hypothetical protein